MLAHRILNHQFVGAYHKRSALDEQEKADCFKGRDRGLRKATVEIVNYDDELIDVGGFEKFLELVPKGVDVLRKVVTVVRCLPDKFARFFRDPLQILERDQVLRLC